MKWMKKNLSTIVLLCAFFFGICLLLYPTVSDWWNSFHQSRVIATYVEAVEAIEPEAYEEMMKRAEEYNETLVGNPGRWILKEEQQELYQNSLNATGTGMIGYLEIPKLHISLPIYHGTSEAVLQVAVGHIAGSSLPTVEKGTHCVLSGHRGVPSAKLFTNLDEMKEGDVFAVHVLNRILTYEVDQIQIVEPEDLSALEIEEGKELCTLVTCTPYGVNTHRILVRGERVEAVASESESELIVTEAVWMEPEMVVSIATVLLLLLLLIILLVKYRKK